MRSQAELTNTKQPSTSTIQTASISKSVKRAIVSENDFFIWTNTSPNFQVQAVFNRLYEVQQLHFVPQGKPDMWVHRGIFRKERDIAACCPRHAPRAVLT